MMLETKIPVCRLLMAGTDFKISSEQMRSRLALEPEKIPLFAERLREKLEFSECLILATCNRIEIYAAGANAPQKAERLLRFLEEHHRIPGGALQKAVQILEDREAAEHLFRVASGIESLVIGEEQILGQVKEAYRQAVKHQTTGKLLHRLFQKAIRAGKKARTETQISQGKVSVASLAADLAVKLFKGKTKPLAAVIGAGRMGYLTAKRLADWSDKPLLIVNRDPEKGQELAALCAGEYLPYRERYQLLSRADLVISTVSPGKPVFEAEKFPSPVKTGALIDIAFPAGVGPEIGKIIPLYTLEGLESLAAEKLKNRKSQIREVENLLQPALEEFQDWYKRYFCHEQP